jgi:hypothetical protein
VLEEAFDERSHPSSAPRQWKKLLITKARVEGVAKRCEEGDLWQADHKVAVMDGGGEATSAQQFQTLCVPCHMEKTRHERARGAKRSRK